MIDDEGTPVARVVPGACLTVSACKKRQNTTFQARRSNFTTFWVKLNLETLCNEAQRQNDRKPAIGAPTTFILVIGNCTTRQGGLGSNISKMVCGAQEMAEALSSASKMQPLVAVSDFSEASYEKNSDGQYNQTWSPPALALAQVRRVARAHADALIEEGAGSGSQVFLVPAGAWVHSGGPLGAGIAELYAHLDCHGMRVFRTSDIPYPRRRDGGARFVEDTIEAIARTSNAGALHYSTEMERVARHAGQRAADRHFSSIGTAVMSGPHAHRIHSAGGTATMSGPHAHRITAAGGKASQKAKAGKRLNDGAYTMRLTGALTSKQKANQKYYLKNREQVLERKRQRDASRGSCFAPR